MRSRLRMELPHRKTLKLRRKPELGKRKGVTSGPINTLYPDAQCKLPLRGRGYCSDEGAEVRSLMLRRTGKAAIRTGRRDNLLRWRERNGVTEAVGRWKRPSPGMRSVILLLKFERRAFPKSKTRQAGVAIILFHHTGTGPPSHLPKCERGP